MKVFNNCSFPVIFRGWRGSFENGSNVVIEPGEFVEVAAFCANETRDAICYYALNGSDIILDESAGQGNSYQVVLGVPLNLISGDINDPGTSGIHARHYAEVG